MAAMNDKIQARAWPNFGEIEPNQGNKFPLIGGFQVIS